MQIKDKKAIVIGSSNGLGAAFTKELLRNSVAHDQIMTKNQLTINKADIPCFVPSKAGMVSVAMLAMEHMGRDKGGKGGVLINIAEHLDVHCTAQLPVYTATKQAIIGLSQSLAQPYHYQRTGVRIIVLCPGLTESPVLENLKSEEFVPRPEELMDAMKEIHRQRAESVAHALVYVIRCAQNGSVWISEDGKPVYEIQMPDTLPTK
ncbi:alcohol dehydrogenase 1-like [Copidosoma floridanum]|uniref:alcohol dehydrogenase 1-like n=1 Tax=Copidosoma floridanum TaxID=29053 RepID=UPI000C6F59FC|nr:alcohol dehydrogenase 1-like [Copidosoma floridanum]